MKKYNIRSGIEQRKLKLKRIAVAILASGGLVTGIAVPAMAAGGGYGTQPGYQQASTCGSDHGAFGAFNGDNNLAGGTSLYHGGLTHSDVVGQTPGATGYNNSHTNCQG